MRCAWLPIAVAIAVLPAGCGHAPGYPPDPIPRPTAVTDFASLYGQNCAACHGGNGQSGPSIDLANPEYQALINDATLRKWISGGVPGTEMPAFAQSAGGMLTDAQVEALIAGMRKAWSQPNAFADAAPPPYAETRPGDADRGETTYRSRCAACHESNGEQGRQQITSPVYLSLVADQTLRTIIIAGRPDIGQPDWRHDGAGGKTAAPLSSEEVDDIVTYMASLRNSAPQLAAEPAKQQSAPSAADGRSTK